MKRFSIIIAVLLMALGAVAGRVIFGSGSQPSAPASAAGSTSRTVSTASFSVPTTNAIDQATVHAYQVGSASVVYVLNPGVGSGSGIIYDSQGDIVTNHHVVSGGSNLSVTLNNGKVYPATIVGSDTADDLAVIRIHASGLTPAQFAKAGQYQVGQMVLAIGSPLGLKASVTSGLISGIHRVEQEPNGSYLSDAVQTSAPINPGNSGGALFTLDDLVVGMPTLQQTSSSSGSTAQAIGFAIPSERIVYVADQIIKTGSVQHTGRPYMGLAPTDSTGGASDFGFNTPTTQGAVVANVASNGPAAKAGIQQGDVITSINGVPVTATADLLTVVATQKPGDTITLQVNRNGQTSTVHLTLGELPAQ